MQKGFLLLAEQETRVLKHQKTILDQAALMDNLPDERDAILRSFQLEFNSFLKRWPDLISKAEVKEEYHNRSSYLIYICIFQIIENSYRSYKPVLNSYVRKSVILQFDMY